MIAKIYILLPVYNRQHITARFITCLREQTFANYHLVLIDDGSTDETTEMVRREIPSTTVIRGCGSWWWAGSLQQGYNWLESKNLSPCDMVLIINDDTEFNAEFLQVGFNIINSLNKKTLLLAQCYSRETKELIDTGTYVNWKNFNFNRRASPEQINCLSTRGLFLMADDFISLGGFYPTLLPHYASDYEFTMRAHRRGWNLKTDSSLYLYVDEKTSGNRDFNDANITKSLKKLFSKKTIANPIYSCNFIIIACPWRFKLKCLFFVFYRTFFILLKVFGFTSLKQRRSNI